MLRYLIFLFFISMGHLLQFDFFFNRTDFIIFRYDVIVDNLQEEAHREDEVSISF